jgi:hypothetical protein
VYVAFLEQLLGNPAIGGMDSHGFAMALPTRTVILQGNCMSVIAS